MNKNTAGRMTIVALLTLIGGCAVSTTPETDSHFSESLNTLKAQQTLNPEASRNTNPVAGIDGKAARGAYDNYRDSFRKPPAEGLNVTPVSNVGDGGMSAGAR